MAGFSQNDCNCDGTLLFTIDGSVNPVYFSQSPLAGMQTPSGHVYLGDNCVEIIGKFIIDQDVIFMNGEMFMQGGAEMEVISPNTLHLYGGIHLHGCDLLWRSVTVSSGATLYTAETTVLEDALYAIAAFDNSALRVAGTTFNRNFIGIYMQDDVDIIHFLT